MSSERFDRIKFIENDQIILNCPIDFEKGALIFDKKESRVLLQMKLQNISDKIISSVYLIIDSKDDANDPIPGLFPLEYSYLDLNLVPGSSYGEKDPVTLDIRVRNVTVHISKVVFSTGDIWRSEGNKILDIPNLEKIEILGQDLLVHLKRLASNNSFNTDRITYVPEELESMWLCSCGRPNSISNNECVRCQISKSWIFKSTNIEFLQNNLSEYNDEVQKQEIEKQRLNREKMIENDKKKEIDKLRKKKLIKRTVITAPILLIILAALFYSSDQGKYMRVNRYIDDKNYSEALALIESSGKFKDSETLYDGAVLGLANEDYNNGEYDEAIKKIGMLYNPDQISANALAFNSYIEKAKILISQKEFEDADRILNELIVEYEKTTFSLELLELRDIVKKN